MFLSVRDLELKKVRFNVTFPPGKLDFGDRRTRQAGVLRAEGVAELVSEIQEIRVLGRLSGKMELECDRCLESSSVSVDSDFDLYYRPSDTENEKAEREISGEDAEVGFYEGDGLELGDVIREQVLLELPMHHICSENCRGICPLCGENRNESECNCSVSAADDRWAALRNLKVK